MLLAVSVFRESGVGCGESVNRSGAQLLDRALLLVV